MNFKNNVQFISSLQIFLCVALIVSLSMGAAQANDDWNWLLERLTPVTKTKLSETKMGEGLKEALKVGIDNAITQLGRTDGYFGDQTVKILLPEGLRRFESTLRVVGFGNKVDGLVMGMNRAAEAAAPFARDIFVDAIFDMTIEDAQNILNGSDTAATQYFEKSTRNKLFEAFRPAVETQMSGLDVMQQYAAIAGKYQTLPFARAFKLPSVEEYVIDKALDGMFFVLGNEESKIRNNPEARVTKILQDVFK